MGSPTSASTEPTEAPISGGVAALLHVGTGSGEILRLMWRGGDGVDVLSATPCGEMPSFLAYGANHVYAIDEFGETLRTFISGYGKALVEVGRVACEGGPAYLAVDHHLGLAFVANYGGGTIAVARIQDEIIAFAPQQIVAAAKYPHAAVVDPSRRFLLVPCKGADQILVYAIDAQSGRISEEPVHVAEVAAGSGPRHLAFDQSGANAFVSNELDSTVTALAFDTATGRLQLRQVASSLPGGSDISGNTASDICLSRDERLVYVSNRGHDSVMALGSGLSSDPPLVARGHVSTDGAVPRKFALHPERPWLVVANQQSCTLCFFDVLQDGGLRRRGKARLPSPPYWVGFGPG
ncbi:MAG: beta-propeller fold lactonase family protein [Nannocystaceae bacterium]